MDIAWTSHDITMTISHGSCSDLFRSLISLFVRNSWLHTLFAQSKPGIFCARDLCTSHPPRRCQAAESKKIRCFVKAFVKGLCNRFEAIKLERLSLAFSRSKGSWILFLPFIPYFHVLSTFSTFVSPLSFESHFLAFGFATLQPLSGLKPQFLAGSRGGEISWGIRRCFLIWIGFGTHLDSLLLCSY